MGLISLNVIEIRDDHLIIKASARTAQQMASRHLIAHHFQSVIHK
jgi:hypothetical protein